MIKSLAWLQIVLAVMQILLIVSGFGDGQGAEAGFDAIMTQIGLLGLFVLVSLLNAVVIVYKEG